MKKYLQTIFFLFVIISSAAQNFSADSYLDYRKNILGISEVELENMYSRPNDFYIKGFSDNYSINEIQYLDSVIQKLELTNDELELLEQNLFFVSERLSYENFGQAFHTVYNYDLPVFVTSDAILHALHMSYDQILKNLEREIMSPNLEEFIKSLYDNFNQLEQKYGQAENLSYGLKDADLYITIAYSLITGKLQPGHLEEQDKIKAVWDKIYEEKAVLMSLFTFPERKRRLDFSQFTVRGHYVYTQQDEWRGLKSLEPYFRTMMWLGRTDFLLTPPPPNPWEMPWENHEIQRMHFGTFLLNELIQQSGKKEMLDFNEKVINYLVGNSDNITPAEYQNTIDQLGINSAEQLADTATFQNLRSALNSNSELGQKILSDYFLMDPQGDKPGELPISYRVSGQRFIIDSYVMGNVVFDRLLFNGNKVMRMMPNPLDALFTLGNNDVLPLLQNEFSKFPYAEQLANLRYIIDQKTPDFWDGSLYNVWLNSIRELNPAEETSNQPLFMKTAAWHQEKINTQLASWSQLRHDNLLYAKQSYTGGTGCSFPFSYIEPYPEFYKRLKQFAQNAGDFFGQLPTTNYELNRVVNFFPRFEETMGKLENLATKQLEGIQFTLEENDWLKSMLFQEGGSGTPPYSGWYSELFYDVWDAAEGDFTVVDIHTQPTDEAGNEVGKVLHTGVGKVNLGVFIANCPFNLNQQMAFVGPLMSYYETITENFKRMTDEEWEDMVQQNTVPNRPGWTNIYLAGKKGEKLETGIELPSKLYTNISEQKITENGVVVFPNPVSDVLTISVTTNSNEGVIGVYNSTGVLVKQKGEVQFSRGRNLIYLSLTDLVEGLYLVKVSMKNGQDFVVKIIKN